MKIRVIQFKGLAPKIADHLLDEGGAQVAINCDLESGELCSFPRPAYQTELSGSSYKSIFKYYEGSNEHWIADDKDLDWVRSPVALDTFERLYFTGESELRAIANDILSTPFDHTTDYYKPGPPSGAAVTCTGYTPGTTYRAYFYTYVSRYGEEGPPSAITEVTDYGSGTVTLNNIPDPGDDKGCKNDIGGNFPYVRVYRTNASDSGTADFQFVKQVACDAFTWGTTDIDDDIADANLGEVCSTTGYIPAPSGLLGLIGLANGTMAGFKGNQLYFSEPYLPYAWPAAYQIPFEEEIVGLGHFGNTVVVCTDGAPYLVSGSHPSEMYKQKLPDWHPCLSKRGIVSSSIGVIYPSKEGFIVVNQNGVQNITKGFLNAKNLEDYYLSDLHSCFYDGRYIGFYKNAGAGVEGGIVIDFDNGIFVQLGTYAQATWLEVGDGDLWLVSKNPDDDSWYLSEWGEDPYNYLSYTWRSKRFVIPSEVNFSAARIVIDQEFYNWVLDQIEENDYLVGLNTSMFSGKLRGELNGNFLNEFSLNGSPLYRLQNLNISDTINIKVYADGTLKHTTSVSSDAPFRLPGDFKAKHWEIELEGFIPIKELLVATSMRELKRG